jgi:thiamine-phosphate pyrophosphorylase
VSAHYAREMDRRERLTRSRLYLVLEARPHGEDPRPLLDAALRGGVDVVQLRDKDLGDEALVAAAAPFRSACVEHGALFVLNDRPDLATRCGADGVHIGQSDASYENARALVGPSRVVGMSTSSPDEMLSAQDLGADYVGVQTIYPTPTKPDEAASGLWLVEAAARTLTIPWFPIGGIDMSNIDQVVASGAPGVAVVRAIRDAADPEAAARELRAALDRKE